MSQIRTGVVEITTNQAGYTEFDHEVGEKPDQLHTAIIEDPASPGAYAFLVTSWNDATVRGVLFDRATGSEAGEVTAKLRWDAEVVS